MRECGVCVGGIEGEGEGECRGVGEDVGREEEDKKYNSWLS
jgi:hypothetical protein